MVLENSDARIPDPFERDVLERFPSGRCDMAYLQLTATDSGFLGRGNRQRQANCEQ